MVLVILIIWSVHVKGPTCLWIRRGLQLGRCVRLVSGAHWKETNYDTLSSIIINNGVTNHYS